ncbi:MAG: c-type cytochrome [Bryobacterales bacterium]
MRSKVVLKDRYGSMIGAFLKAGHPTQSGQPSASITGDDLINLAHFLHLKVNETLRSGPYSSPIDVLTGDVKAGKEYFNGAGGCTGCHSATGDLKDIGERYDPVTLQQKFLFPKTLGFRRGSGPVTPPKPVTVDVTAAGKTVSGKLIHLDDFNVALRDSAGEYHSFSRTPAVKVVKHDPYQGHVELLDKLNDKNIHDVVAYLESLK